MLSNVPLLHIRLMVFEPLPSRDIHAQCLARTVSADNSNFGKVHVALQACVQAVTA